MSDDRVRIFNERMSEARRAALDMQNAYAKWVIVTLLAINGAGLGYVLAQHTILSPSFPVTPVFLLIGLVAAIGAGAFAWVNYGSLWLAYMDSPYDRFDPPPNYTRTVKMAMYGAVACCFVSAMCLLVAGVYAACSLR